MAEEEQGRNPIVFAIKVTVIAVILVCIIGLSIPSLGPHTLSRNELAAANSLKSFVSLMTVYKKKYTPRESRHYPHGIGNPVTNSGKLCQLLSIGGDNTWGMSPSLGAADCRAAGGTGMKKGDPGFYVPVTRTGLGLAYLKKVSLEAKPYSGYWFGLCMYMGTRKYDNSNSAHHFGIVAFPADYGKTGEFTFIVNEEGTVYCKDLQKGEYLDTYPYPDPTAEGWEIYQ